MLIASEDELKRIAKFCVALYRTEKIIQSAHIASNLLELIVDLWLEKQNVPDSKEDSLYDKINKLNYSGLIYSQSDLDELRLIRNKIVHGYKYSSDNIYYILNLVYFIWDGLDNESYLKCDTEIKQLDLKTAYIWIRDFEVIDTNYFEETNRTGIHSGSIKLNDFNNLYKMAEKFTELANYISTKKELTKHSLSVDNISAINSTSAYVWLAITSGNHGGRTKIEFASVSILATPDNLRIYIDFGGKAFDDRRKYLEFIKATNTTMLNIEDKEDLYIFDIEWYSYIENKVDFNILDDKVKKNNKISSAKKLFEDNGDRIPLASNRLLIGYILQKQDLSFKKILKKLTNIISVYHHFQTFEYERAESLKINRKVNSSGEDIVTKQQLNSLIDKYT
ncbi:hypothetical protein [Poseidonibacter antarcticus]|uniref:hypothetical protein n=1 Tax=Poseidonibacter antarcticus TaxID=2478538 RepID=UPI000EF46BA3|nr:hypothetical protein [Poseidonibacter antarcticus]